MLKLLKRIKRLVELTKKDPKALEVLEGLTEEQLAIVPEAGDGNAVFISEGTREEYKEFEKDEAGMKPWYDRLKNL